LTPTVSVVIPCFNHGQYVDEAVSSALAQSWPEVEILVVDDGSDDPATITRLAELRRPRTRVVRLPRGGLARARNAGIREATGQYLCALDADDQIASDYFATAVRRLEADPSLTFVSCWLQTFGDESWSWTPARCDLVALLAECTVCTASVVRMPAVRAVGGFDERMPHQGWEDWDLWLTLVERGYRGEIVPEFLFRYRRVPGSMSAGLTQPEVHRALMEYLVSKHQASYDRHLPEVLALQDEEIGALLRSNQQLERHLATWLRPEVARREAEMSRLRRLLDDADDRRAAASDDAAARARVETLERELAEARAHSGGLAAALHAAAAEVEALRSSKSWTLTRPLRAAYEVWLAAARRWRSPPE
jgi:GT2 family glycosyltransferase